MSWGSLPGSDPSTRMVNQDPVSARYAEAFFSLIKPSGRLAETAQGLQRLSALIRAHADLQQFLGNPGLGVEDKVAVLERLVEGAWSDDVRAFVRLVLSMGRAEYLAEMSEAFQALVDKDAGLLRVTIRSAHPLSAAMRERLTHQLERLERRRIEMTEETDPELLGGIQVALDHRVLDGSVKTKLAELRQRLKAVRVH